MPVSLRLIVLLLVGLVAASCDRQKAETPQARVAPAAVAKGLDRNHKGESAPTVSFSDPDGGAFSIASLKGSPVLVNLWATWCAPCVKELPTLEALETEQEGKLAVIAVSQDMAPKTTVDAFLKGKAIGRVAAFHDPEMKLTDALGVQVMPTTVVYDAAGKEVWRYTGDLDWTGAEAKALLSEVSLATN